MPDPTPAQLQAQINALNGRLNGIEARLNASDNIIAQARMEIRDEKVANIQAAQRLRRRMRAGGVTP